MRRFFIFPPTAHVFVQTQTENGNFHFPFISGWFMDNAPLRESTQPTSERNTDLFCEQRVYALKPPTGLLWRTIHWPSGCLCRQRSDRSSPSPASWGAHTPCPSRSVLWSVSAKTNIEYMSVVKRSTTMQKEAELRSSTIYLLKYHMRLGFSSGIAQFYWGKTWLTNIRPH